AALIGVAGASLAGCAMRPSTPASYDDLVARGADAPVDVAALRRAFLVRSDFDERLRELVALEAQVLAAIDERPLRLGAVGSAILDLYYGSLAGHQALARFYAFVDSSEQAAYHERWIAAIQADMERAGDGSVEAPYPVVFANQAKAYLVARGLTTVGTTYEQTESYPLILRAAARRDAGRIELVQFDLSDTYRAYEAAVRRDETTVLPVAGSPATCGEIGICEAFNTFAFVHLLGRGGEDSAAQVLIGRTLMGVAGGKRLEEAAEWLWRAAQAGNGIANLSLAELCLNLAYGATPSSAQVWLERAERRFLLAIAAGFDDAMVQLGFLYLRGEYGDERRPPGVALLRRAARLDNIDALRSLGALHIEGTLVDRDLDAAEGYYLRAAEVDEAARIDYARFLLQPGYDRSFNDRAYSWVRDAAKAKDPHGMLLLAQLYHTGSHGDQSTRRARSWFKRAVRVAPDDPFVVNQAAWTLTVTRLPRLRDPRYAVRIMDRVMADENGQAREDPAYLDTWAAAYAAIGNFERAITIQEEAIAKEQGRSDPRAQETLPILLEHLAAFRAGERISDEAIP
ncbi:MAG: tetratricopeptide repeat protein, partial [Gammaproteobacteria bacterium]|nr:tetratricopeptide repeat protein [Gammaproteobacteria bacterium]